VDDTLPVRDTVYANNSGQQANTPIVAQRHQQFIARRWFVRHEEQALRRKIEALDGSKFIFIVADSVLRRDPLNAFIGMPPAGAALAHVACTFGFQNPMNQTEEFGVGVGQQR
jgi:hypothetical protein